VIGIIEHQPGAGGPWANPIPPVTGESSGPSRFRVIADWVVPHPGPSGPVNSANYAVLSSFDIDWLNTTGFQTLLDNLAASPGAFRLEHHRK
jgi:hypothetical protein